MASSRRSTKPKRKSKTRSKALSAVPGRALRQNLAAASTAGGDLVDVMGNMMARYAELPIRLLRARSPFEVWQEQMRFVQSVTNAYRMAARVTMAPAAVAKKEAPAKRSRAR
jgi:hypothetical protein